MQTLNKLVYELRNIFKLHSDDSLITNKLLAQYIKEARAKLLEEDLAKGKIISDEFIQSLLCLEFAIYNFEGICCNDDFDFESCLVRSVQQLPITIQRNSRNSIVAVQSVDLTKDYSETTHYRSKYNKYNRFTKNSIRWYLKDNYMYLTNTKEITRLSVSGIFADPEDVSAFSTCAGSSCFNWDSQYPVAAGMVKRIIDMVLKERLGFSYTLREDEENDADEKKQGQDRQR